MSPIPRPVRFYRRWLFLFVALLGATAQLTVALAPLAEGRDARMGSHIESSGTRAHFTHDDAKCVSCQARSIHGTTERASLPTILERLSPTVADRAIVRGVSNDHNPQVNPRAPPVVI